MSYVIYRRTFALAALLTLAFVANAGTPVAQVNDLGQSWPRAQNVSISAGWNVYVFTRDGVRYIQVNDTNGNVHAAFAIAGGQVLVLPIGADAQRVQLASQSPQAMAAAIGGTVYRDRQVQLTSVAQADGLAWQIVTTTSAAASSAPANVATCKECGSGIYSASQQSPLQP